MSFVWVRRLAFVGAVFCFLLIISNRVALAGAPSATVPSFISNNQATHLLGETLENTDGEKLGKIKDLVIATPSGEVKYVLVTTGGILGVAAHTKIVPAHAVSLATTKAGIAWLDINLRRWRTAPQFKRLTYSELADPKKAALVDQFYSASTGTKGTTPATATTAATTTKRMEPTGTNRTARASAPGVMILRLVSELMGRRVQGPGGQSIGVLSDFLIDLEGRKPTFGIIWAYRQSRKDYTFAVPYGALGFDGVRFTTGASLATLERARNFNTKVWAAPEPNAIYRYQMIDAANTARNARDRAGLGLTPVDQSETEPDLQITSRVRQQLMGDDKLTFTAKNVKIITVNGYVTLRGPVKHQAEKEIIQHQAELVAGNGKVENLLEVEQE